MAKEPAYLTAQGKLDLETELTELVEIKRPEIAATILAAREDGDLKENGAYHDAKDRQGHLEGRIRWLKATLDRARIIDPPATRDSVDLGCVVTIADPAGTTERYAIVGSTEAKVAAGRISNASPLGRSLMGRKVGEAATVRAPNGETTFTINAIDWS
ncbi:MAG: transcription elongation factor GreA [Chloroflexota bacterium]